MKRIIWVILIIVCMFTFTGCELKRNQLEQIAVEYSQISVKVDRDMFLRGNQNYFDVSALTDTVAWNLTDDEPDTTEAITYYSILDKEQHVFVYRAYVSRARGVSPDKTVKLWLNDNHTKIIKIEAEDTYSLGGIGYGE